MIKTRTFWILIIISAVIVVMASVIAALPFRKWRVQSYFRERAQRENVPIVFYGRVGEQDGTPVSGATIDLRISSSNSHPLSENDLHKSQQFQKVTDDNGLFSIDGYTGLFLEVQAISKDGFRSDLKVSRFFHYSPKYEPGERHYPDPANPVLFYMWKKGLSTAVVEREIDFRLHVDNRPVTIDLLTGKWQPGRVDSGDLQVSLKRQEGLLYPKPPYDWEFEIKAVNGGIVETNDVFLYQAPETGYRNEYKYSFRSANVPGGADAKKKYYVRGRDGSFFASLDVEVHSNGDSRDEAWGGIRIHCLLHPWGSRNLEPDKSKKLDPRASEESGPKTPVSSRAENNRCPSVPHRWRFNPIFLNVPGACGNSLHTHRSASFSLQSRPDCRPSFPRPDH
jgi:hypothetical protein